MVRIRNILNRAAAVFFATAVCVTVSGCSDEIDMGIGSMGEKGNTANIIFPDGSGSSGAVTDHLPTKREDGRKFKMAVLCNDSYNENLRMMYYLAENLKEDGWISYDSIPCDPYTYSNVLDMLGWLADNAESEYMEFDRDVHYYTSEFSKEEIYESLRTHIEEKKDIDLVLTLTTSASLMLEKFDFDIPLLMYGLSDPVASGLIVSADDSGDSRYWAHVDSSAYYRQLQYYFDTIEFSNLGAVYIDEIVAGMPEYRKAAEDNGFDMTEYSIDRDSRSEDEYYESLAAIHQKMIEADKVDAYILTSDLISSTAKAKELLQVFLDANIPIFVQEGSAYVIDGAALMIVDMHDASGTAPFVANVIGAVFNGAAPGDLEQEYISSPSLTINLDVADAIEYYPPFEMLLSCERIVCGG